MPKETRAKAKPGDKRFHNPGRPTKYKEEYCQGIIDYFSIPLLDDEGNPSDPRYVSAFAFSIGTTVQTLHAWRDKYPNFLGAYNTARAIQQNFFTTQALQNRYNASFTWRAMMNMFGWRDKIENTVDVKPLVYIGDGDSDG